MDYSLPQVISQYIRVDESGCHVWTGKLTKDGYGRMWSSLAHKVVYELLFGAVPVGLELDHKCRNRACVNPKHLEPVTHLVNMGRGIQATKTHCKHGHEFTPENTYRRGGRRACRQCRRTGNPRGRPIVAEIDRFTSHIHIDPSGCHMWTAYCDRDGYPSFTTADHRNVRASRWIVEREHGPIPEGFVVSPDCRIRSCVNPTHLKVVTMSQAAANTKKTHCKRGHPLSGDNLVEFTTHRGRPGRCCLTCRRDEDRERKRRYRLQKKAAA